MKNLFFSNTQYNEILIKTLGKRLALLGGLIFENTENALSESRCCIYPAAAAAGIEGFPEWNCIQDSPDGLYWDNDLLRVHGVDLVKEASYYPAAVFCGIGKSDLIVPQFRTELERTLNSALPCIGTIASISDIEMMQGLFGLGDKIRRFHSQLLAALDQDSQTLLLAECSKEKAEGYINQWLSDNVL